MRGRRVGVGVGVCWIGWRRVFMRGGRGSILGLFRCRCGAGLVGWRIMGMC